MDVLSEEIVIVGSRYGELADVVIPLFEKGEPINSENIVSELGGDEVILRPDDNKFDSFAVAVYTVLQRLLGYVWMYQSHAMRQWTERLQRRIDNLLRFIPMDLSASSYMECIELYCMMKQSPIEEQSTRP